MEWIWTGGKFSHPLHRTVMHQEKATAAAKEHNFFFASLNENITSEKFNWINLIPLWLNYIHRAPLSFTSFINFILPSHRSSSLFSHITHATFIINKQANNINARATHKLSQLMESSATLRRFLYSLKLRSRLELEFSAISCSINEYNESLSERERVESIKLIAISYRRHTHSAQGKSSQST